MIETRSCKDYALGNGRHRLEVFGFPVQIRDGGAWQDIDLSLVDGKVRNAPYDLTVDSEKQAIVFTDRATGEATTLSLATIGGVSAVKSTPVIASASYGSSVTWKGVATDTDLVLRLHHSGVSLTRVLKSGKAPLTATFNISGKDVPCLARDADGNSLTVTKSVASGVLTETISTNVAKNAKYPIEIDPSPLTVQPSAKDTYVESGNATTNYGTITYVRLGDSNTNKQRMFLQFDISALPAGATLTSATMSLYHYLDAFTGKTVWAYKLTRTDWVEAQLTWNIYKTGSNWSTAGGDYVTSNPSGGSVSSGDAAQWIDWNVLAIVQDAYTNSITINVIVKFETETLTSGQDYPRFYSREYATDTTKRPKLVIAYTTETPANKDISTRFKVIVRNFKDGASRFRVWARNFKDAPARFKVWARAYKDSATRFKAIVRGFKDAPSRIKIIVQSWQDAASRFTTWARGFTDIPSRFTITVRGYLDAATRFTVLAGTVAYKDIANRFTLMVQGFKDAGTRAVVAVLAYLDAASRFSLIARSFTDVASRFQAVARGFQDAATRFGLRALGYLDAATRFTIWVRQYIDAVSRFALYAQAYRDIASRLTLWVGGFADVTSRFRLWATGYADAAARVTISAFILGYRDAQTRLRLLVRGFKDCASLFVLLARQYQDAITRFRLWGRTYQDCVTRVSFFALGRANLTSAALAVAGLTDAEDAKAGETTLGDTGAGVATVRDE